jgi:hypothetical protein
VTRCYINCETVQEASHGYIALTDSSHRSTKSIGAGGRPYNIHRGDRLAHVRAYLLISRAIVQNLGGVSTLLAFIKASRPHPELLTRAASLLLVITPLPGMQVGGLGGADHAA